MKITPLIDLEQLAKEKPELHIGVSRRQLFSAFSEGIQAYNRAMDGVPAYKLNELPSMEIERFAALRPAVIPGSLISIRDGYVYGKPACGGDTLALFALDSDALFIFNQFNDQQTIAEISRKLVDEKGWEQEKASRTVRAFFFKLCEARICQPGNDEARPDSLAPV